MNWAQKGSACTRVALLLCCIACASALFSPVDDAFDKHSMNKAYHRVGAEMCEVEAAVNSVTCYVSRENKYVMGLQVGHNHAPATDMCSTDADLHDAVTVTAGPGEVFVGVKVCHGRQGGIKKLLFIKDTGAVEVCGNTDSSSVAYDYNWRNYGTKLGRLDGAAKFHGGRAMLGSRGKSKEHQGCHWLVPRVQPQWAHQLKGKPWMAHGVADRSTYTVNGHQYSKMAWTGPYSDANHQYHMHDEYYDGYYKQVHPLASLSATCSHRVAGGLWDLRGSFNKCYHPDEHQLNLVEVKLTAVLEDDVTCMEAEKAQGVLFQLMEAGVQHAAETKHVSSMHEFFCNDNDGTSTVTVSVIPYGGVNSEQLFKRLQVLSHSDLCEADVGRHPALRAFCNMSVDRHIAVSHHDTSDQVTH